MSYVRGVDVSVIQDPATVPWEKLRDEHGVRFTYIRAENGNNGIDGRFQGHLQRARAAGIIVGPYMAWFPLPSGPGLPAGRSPEEQADAFLAACGGPTGVGTQDGDLPPMLDLEWPEPAEWLEWGCTAPQIRAHCLAGARAVAQRFGCWPTLYSYPDWWMRIGGPSEPAFTPFPLYQASYRPKANVWPADGEQPPTVDRPWQRWAVWQFSGGDVTGLGVHVDTDVIASEDVLQKLCTADLTATW